MSRPKVSIVVPIYNVRAYLGQCIDSLLAQTLDNIEIVLVDDGSPDDCGAIADRFASEHCNIKVIHRDNGGLGPARNSGIEVATGEYVGFVDSDDWVEPDMFESLYSVAVRTDADAVYCGYKVYKNGEIVSINQQPMRGMLLEGEDEIFSFRRSFYGSGPHRYKEDPTPVSVWVGLYRCDLIRSEGLSFYNIRSEDKFFNTQFCRMANRVCCIGGSPYCYRKDEQPSITKSFKSNTVDELLELFEQLLEMAYNEDQLFRQESVMRAKRCVFDYTRSLICLIETPEVSYCDKRGGIRRLLGDSSVRVACEGYPFWKLPCGQMFFYLGIKLRSVGLTRLLAQIRRIIMS